MSKIDQPPIVTLADGTTIGDHFIIRRKLGGGGMGEVYLAENLELPDKKYAIKVLRSEFSHDPRFVSMLQDEAKKQARLEHDNVVQIYDLLKWAGHYCLIQSFVNGKTLASMIEEEPQGLKPAVALPLMLDILKGLDHAHAIGILHCDVKPANVIVDMDGRARVTDFGISRDIGPIARDSGLVGVGTPEYMSPEQIIKPYEVDHRTDVFSAGVMFFEMLCGRLPFEAPQSQDNASMPQIIMDAPDVRQFRNDIPEALARIVATGLQRDPALRFQGCVDFHRAIVDFRRRERWRRTWLPAIIGSSIIAVIGAVGLYQWRESVNRKAIEGEKQNELVQINETIKTAAKSMNLLCREMNALEDKRPGLKMAQDHGDPEIVKKFERKLADMVENTNTYAADYMSAIQQLSSLESAVVSKELAAQSSSDPMVSKVADTIRGDDAALRARKSVRTQQELVGRCPN